MPVKVGAGGLVTVNDTPLLVPPAVVTVTVRAVAAALVAMAQLALTVVAVGVLVIVQVTPLPEAVTAEAPARLVPVSVTGTVVPRRPEFGAMLVNAGGRGTVTVNVTALLVPPPVVTVIVRAVVSAVALMRQFALTVVAVGDPVIVQFTPVPETFTEVALAR